MSLIPGIKYGKWVLVGLVVVISIGSILLGLALRKSPVSRHAEETVVHGYGFVDRNKVGDTGIEVIYAGPRDEKVAERISAPGLKMSDYRRVFGPTRYDWTVRGEFDDGCRVFVERLDPASQRGSRYLTDQKSADDDNAVDILSLKFVCGTG